MLVSTIHGYPILTASRNQTQFAIQSDDDFVIKLNNPWEGGVKYVLTVPDDQRGANDPLNVRYEDIYETGSVVGTLEAEWSNSGSGQPDWRLYRVFSTTPADYR